jgi:DinB family protein
MSRAADALGRIESARRYTTNLLGHVPPTDWFRMPSEGVTHIAWQVGHLAMAEYRLALERIRGKRPEDHRVLPELFLERFGKGSAPTADPAVYPPIEEIRHVFDAVHRQVQTELAGIDDAALESPPAAPHRLFTTKRGALLWCAEHEMLHAGQIGLLRRLLGSQPVW